MGIQGFLHGEDAFLELPVDGIRLQVDEADAEKALGILDHHEGLTPLPENFVPPPVVEEEQPTDGAE